MSPRKGALPRSPITNPITSHNLEDIDLVTSDHEEDSPRRSASPSQVVRDDVTETDGSPSQRKINFSSRKNQRGRRRGGKEVDRRQTFDPEFVIQTQQENKELHSLISTLQDQIRQQGETLARMQNDLLDKSKKIKSPMDSGRSSQRLKDPQILSNIKPYSWDKDKIGDNNDHSSKNSSIRSSSCHSKEKMKNPRTYRTPDLLEKLDDGSSPTYDAWEIMLQGNLEIYESHWDTERQRMNYIFRQTKGIAQGHLTQRMKLDHPQAFDNFQAMLDWLSSFFKDPNEKETARIAYQKCRMSSNESFNQFYSRFSELSCKARIDPADTLSDLFHKLSTDLHRQSIALMADNPPLSVALQKFQFYDNELRLNKAATKFPLPRTGENSAAKTVLLRPHSTSNVSSRGLSASQTVVAGALPDRNGNTPYNAANQEPSKVKCFICKAHGHIAPECPKRLSSQRATSHQVAQLEEVHEEDEEEIELCVSENEKP